jgi:agmatine deiminase
LSRVERVNMLVCGRKRRLRVAEMLDRACADLSRVTLIRAATDRVWLRDSGPNFLVNGKAEAEPLALLHWKFNAWAKYDNFHRDKNVPRLISRRLGARRWIPRVELDGKPRRVVLEGGAIDVNGRGTLLTTEECLLSDVQARNPGLGREGVERVAADYLGARHVIWLGPGIAGDDTRGHVDDIARFVGPRKVVAVVERRTSDPNYEPLQENWRRLEAARDQDGQPLELVRLPMPEPVMFEGERLPASYANFYIANGLVLVPTFNDPADREALDTLASVFPEGTIVGIHCVDLVLGLGTLHCLTQQRPASG